MTQCVFQRPPRTRLDRLLADRGLASSREAAQALILAGKILVDGRKAEKCGTVVSAAACLTILGSVSPYVSRAGAKLAGALDHFGIDPRGRICLDVGASTGGFTQCLLERGAARVYAIDAGTNQLARQLREDLRVVVMEKTNARYLRPEDLSECAGLVTMDVSFISTTMIIPAIPPLVHSRADALVLVKPQFEVGRGRVGRGGIVRDPALHREAVEKVSQSLHANGFRVAGWCESSLAGAEGNREFFVHALWQN